MPAKLPPEFDPERYFAAHPDVALSGLSPQDHYLRFGRLFGRDPRGRGSSAKPAPSERTAPPSPAPDAALAGKPPAAPIKEAIASQPIIDRPKDLSPSQFIPVPASPKPGAGRHNDYSLETIAKGPFASAQERGEICQPLIAYARMLSLDALADVPCSSDADECGATLFQSGETRLENIWFAGPRLIRLMIQGGSGADARTSGWSLRAYQAKPGTPGQLAMAGQGIQLPPSGPVFHDLPLVDPLMPLLFELSDEAGHTRALGLLPFPSLLPGGLHHAELRALQIEANPVDAVWTLSRRLLAEMLGDPRSPARSVTALSCETTPADEAETRLRSDIGGWLEALFGLSIDETLGKLKPQGLCLSLPAASIPTISALVSRQLDVGGSEALTGPFLVSEATTNRPRWSIVLPPDQGGANGQVPFLFKENRKSKGSKTPAVLPVHLAIVTRAPRPVSAPARVDHLSSSSLSLTVLLQSHDPEPTSGVLSELKSLAGGGDLQLFVRMPRGADQRMTEMLNEVIGPEKWQATGSENVTALAASARHDLVLTLSDRVKLDGSEPLSSLVQLLSEDETIGSVGCALMGAAALKTHSIARPTYAGLFPSRVSFASSPHLTFYEPDLSDALLNVAYPVIANSLALSLWRRSVLASLPAPTGPVPTGAEDLRIGLEAIKAGYRNVCTTKAGAELRGGYVPRDMIDPLGSTYLQPGSWENILGRVTILRELF